MGAAPKRKRAYNNPHEAERRRSLVVRTAVTVGVIVIAASIAGTVIATHRDGPNNDGDTKPPSVVTGTGSYRVNDPATPKATLTLIEDFQCPACKVFETQFADALAKLRNNPDVAVDYNPIAILDAQSTTRYSTRAANAVACVAEQTATDGNYTNWLAFHDALYAQQPREGGSGLSDSTLSAIADRVGVRESIRPCVVDQRYSGWVAAQTARTSKAGLTGTPQVELNGKPLKLSTPDDLLSAVAAAVAQ